MSSASVAIVRDFCEAVAAEKFDRLVDKLDPEVVWLGTRGGLDENRVARGPQAVLDYLTEIHEPWERLHFQPERFIDAGDAVVVFWRERARARHSDLELQDETAMTFRLRDGKVVEMTGYLDRDEALLAVEIEP